MRHIPIFTFINKMDREARDPFELMDEIETVLGIRTCPVNWPIGCGHEFKGVYDRNKKTITTFQAAMGGQKTVDATEVLLGDPQVDWLIGEDYQALRGGAGERHFHVREGNPFRCMNMKRVRDVFAGHGTD